MQFDIRRLDIYRKVPKDLTQPTFAGACISVSSVLFILYLFFSELTSFLTPEIASELFVDDPAAHAERIPVYIDISLLKMPCDYVGLDIQDDLGRHEVGFVDNVIKEPIGEEGCQFKANFKINKVPGNFHVSTHSAREQPENPDMTHVVNEVIFGDRVSDMPLPGSFNPLYAKDKSAENSLSSHDYFMKVVPTVYTDSHDRKYFPYQYTYAHRSYVQFGHSHRVIPAIWFRYDLSPITVRYTVKPKPFYSFLTTVCAIIGGTFTVAGILDSMLFTAGEVFKKAELGKLS